MPRLAESLAGTRNQIVVCIFARLQDLEVEPAKGFLHI